jgi:hypothetical protein
VKAASDIYAPVSGVVTEINEQLNDQANLLNKDSEGRGESRCFRRLLSDAVRFQDVVC